MRRSAVLALVAAAFASRALAAERELDTAPPPSSARDIETPIERVFPEEVDRPPLFPWFREQLEDLPPFFADTFLEARFRTYYLRKDRASDVKSEAWTMGGSLAYRSGWLADTFRVDLEGFTSQPLVASDRKAGTLLLQPVQDGITVLGIANGRLRYEGIVLTGGRQHLDLPYFNRQDNRMIPNTFESLVLTKPEGDLTFSTGYSWKVKLRASDEFETFTDALGLEKDRGMAHGGVQWNPNDSLNMGFVAAGIPDLLAGAYGELNLSHDFFEGQEARLDAQFTYRKDVGDDLGDGLFDESWNLGLRSSASYEGLVARLGMSITSSSSGSSIISFFGTNPSYVDLMQRTFTRENEKALLASLSYDFAGVGLEGLSLIVNFVAGFDSDVGGVSRDAKEVDVTLDYRAKKGWLRSFWLRLRGSWLDEDKRQQDGTDIRVIVRYDFPVI